MSSFQEIMDFSKFHAGEPRVPARSSPRPLVAQIASCLQQMQEKRMVFNSKDGLSLSVYAIEVIARNELGQEHTLGFFNGSAVDQNKRQSSKGRKSLNNTGDSAPPPATIATLRLTTSMLLHSQCLICESYEILEIRVYFSDAVDLIDREHDVTIYWL